MRLALYVTDLASLNKINKIRQGGTRGSITRFNLHGDYNHAAYRYFKHFNRESRNVAKKKQSADEEKPIDVSDGS